MQRIRAAGVGVGPQQHAEGADVVAGNRPSPCTVADGLEADWIAEACTKSLKEHRPVRIDEVRK